MTVKTCEREDGVEWGDLILGAISILLKEIMH